MTYILGNGNTIKTLYEVISKLQDGDRVRTDDPETKKIIESLVENVSVIGYKE